MKYILSGLLLGTLLCTACDKDDDDNSNNGVSSADQDFMVKASYSNLAEVGAGQVAVTNGDTVTVKNFGGMMITDHTSAETSLDSIATAFKVTIPSTPDSAHVAKANYLQTLSGHTFDTAYINAQVIDHQNTVALFQQEASSGSNATVKNFVTTHLPVIQMHLQEALQIQSQLK